VGERPDRSSTGAPFTRSPTSALVALPSELQSATSASRQLHKLSGINGWLLSMLCTHTWLHLTEEALAFPLCQPQKYWL
jgi:hypothetical protein